MNVDVTEEEALKLKTRNALMSRLKKKKKRYILESKTAKQTS